MHSSSSQQTQHGPSSPSSHLDYNSFVIENGMSAADLIFHATSSTTTIPDHHHHHHQHHQHDTDETLSNSRSRIRGTTPQNGALTSSSSSSSISSNPTSTSASMLALNNLRSLYESCNGGVGGGEDSSSSSSVGLSTIGTYGFTMPLPPASSSSSSSSPYQTDPSLTQQQRNSNGFINWSNCLTDSATFGNVGDETNCLYLSNSQSNLY